MRNQWMDRVSDYVDGELSPAERVRFERRMDEDGELRRAVEEVRAIVDRASGLGPVEPGQDLWPAIAARLGEGAEPGPVRQPRRPASPAPRPLLQRRAATIAAGLALMLLSASAGWWLHGLGTPDARNLAAVERPALPAPEADATSAHFVEQEQRLAESILDLETLLQRHGDRLDPDTREAIVANLELIDAAIADAHRALRDDPNDDYLRAHITESLERKVRLLEDATRLASQEI